MSGARSHRAGWVGGPRSIAQAGLIPSAFASDSLFEPGFLDWVVRSDRLEHLIRPEPAPTECRRVPALGGPFMFGGPGDLRDDYTVHHEFGAVVWIPVLRAGFAACTLHCLEYPAGLAIEARP